MSALFDILLFGLFFVAIRVNAEEDIKGFIEILKTIQADDSASYPVISIGKLISPDNVEIYEAEIKTYNSPQKSENESSKPQNSYVTSGDEINVDSMLPASDFVQDVNKNDLHRQIQPMDMHYHKHGSGWWPGFNHRFHSKWRPGGRDWPSHYNYGNHHRPHGHHYHNAHNNHGSWPNQGYNSPNYFNSYHDHNNPSNYRPSYYERPSSNHENVYHNHPYHTYFHNNHNNEYPNYSDNRPPYNERPSENNETNNPLQPVFNNSNDDNIYQQTENPITNSHDEDLINPITDALPPQPQTEVSPHNNENLDQLYTQIFGVPTTTEEEFVIDQRMKDESADALVYEENTSQVIPVTPEA